MADGIKGMTTQDGRTDAIRKEATRRVAEQGGNPANMRNMMQMVMQEMNQRDEMQRNSGRGDDSLAFQQPNNVENYLDTVLQMSGMVSGPQAAPAMAAPTGAVETAALPPVQDEDTNVSPEDEIIRQAEKNGLSVGEIAAALGTLGVAGGGAYYLMKKFGKGGTGPNGIDGGDATTPPGEGTSLQELRPNDSVSMNDFSDMDEEIARTNGEAYTDANGRPRRMSENGWPKGTESWAEGGNRDQVISKAASMSSVRDAVNYLKQNGIELDEQVMRSLADIANSVRAKATGAAGRAARRGM